MKCTTCGADISEDARQCPECGAVTETMEQYVNETTPSGEPEPEAGEESEVETAEDFEVEEAKESEAEAGEESEVEAGEESEAEFAQEAKTESVSEIVAESGTTQEVSSNIIFPEINVSSGSEKSGNKFSKLIPGVLIALALLCAAGFAAAKMGLFKSPKQTVIDAFENILPEKQVSPIEKIFAFEDFEKYSRTADLESGMKLVMSDCSEDQMSSLIGSGLSLQVKTDRTNKKSTITADLLYNSMNFASLNAYYGDEKLMLSIPQLYSKVFVMDVSHGFAKRLKDSPVLGPVLEARGADLDGLDEYMEELKAEGDNPQPVFDYKALMDRYKEGCKAKDNFNEALTVTKGEKGSFTMNGKVVSCKGYEVAVSKDSVIDFLRSSSDFFLNDQKLKDDYLKQLEMTVKVTEFLGGGATGMSAEEQQNQVYEGTRKSVEEMITYLDDSMDDIQMTVYVDSKGRLAYVEGQTDIQIKDNDTEEVKDMGVEFQLNLEGGTYLTQNLKIGITLTDPETDDAVKMSLIKQGVDNKKQLTCDASFDIAFPHQSSYNMTYTGTYDKKDRGYHIAIDAGDSQGQIMNISVTGAVDQLKKGKSYHVNIDSLEAKSSNMTMKFSGEFYMQPLTGKVTALEGDTFDILKADINQFRGVAMEVQTKLMNLNQQLN